MWVAGPAASALLGDWGADVVKVEPPEGDPFRGLFSPLGAEGSNPPFELDNRNKRSVSWADPRWMASGAADLMCPSTRLPSLKPGSRVQWLVVCALHVGTGPRMARPW